MTATALSLQDVADALGVHYMTAYRYVRTGRLPAAQVNGQWRVEQSDLDSLRRSRRVPAVRGAGTEATVERLGARLLAGDESGAWSLISDALASSLDPVGVHLQLLAPALQAIGESWAAGTVTIDQEHRATAVAGRLIGRLGVLFTRPGRKRGAVVLAAAPGDLHAIPVALAADIAWSANFTVVDLGASVPPDDLARAASNVDDLVAVGICVSAPGLEPAVRRAIQAVRRAVPAVPVLVGGSGVDGARAGRLAADGIGADAPALVGMLDEFRPPGAHVITPRPSG